MYFLALFTKKPRKKITNSVAISVHSSQIVYLKYLFPLKKIKAFEKMAESRSGKGLFHHTR